MKGNKIKINETSLSYEFFESDEPKNDTILILHWWQWASSSWSEVWKILGNSWYNVVIPDIPCASKNTKCNDIYNLDSYAELIEEFIWDLVKKHKKIDFSNLILWGHSNGWAISIKLTNRKKINILRLILNNSAWIRNDKNRSFKRKVFNFFTKIGKKVFSCSILKKLWVDKIRNLFYRAIWSQDYLNAEKNPKLKETYLNMISSDLKDEIKLIDKFTLLIWWENDNYTPVSDAYFMRNNIKRSKLVILDNETHWIHLKNPERLVQVFLDNI